MCNCTLLSGRAYWILNWPHYHSPFRLFGSTRKLGCWPDTKRRIDLSHRPNSTVTSNMIPNSASHTERRCCLRQSTSHTLDRKTRMVELTNGLDVRVVKKRSRVEVRKYKESNGFVQLSSSQPVISSSVNSFIIKQNFSSNIRRCSTLRSCRCLRL